METVNVHQAKTQFSRFWVELERKSLFLIGECRLRSWCHFSLHVLAASLGLDRERFTVPDDFDAPLPNDLLVAFEGSEGEAAARYSVLALVVQRTISIRLQLRRSLMKQ